MLVCFCCHLFFGLVGVCLAVGEGCYCCDNAFVVNSVVYSLVPGVCWFWCGCFLVYLVEWLVVCSIAL